MQPNPFLADHTGSDIDVALRRGRVLRAQAFRDMVTALFGSPASRDVPHRRKFWPELVRCDLPFGPTPSTRP